MQGEAINLEASCSLAAIEACWIAALDRHLVWDDLPRSYRLLNAVLHALHMAHAEEEAMSVRSPARQCGTTYGEDVVRPAAFDIALLRQRVETGFKPDRLDNPEGAVLAVLDVLAETLNEADLGQIRQSLASSAAPPCNSSKVKWSESWLSPS
jgi:uncharacterized protein (DUF2267 family)